MYQSDLQNAKELVWRFYQKLDNAKVSEMADIIAAHTDEHHVWLGYHPFNEIKAATKLRMYSGLHFAMRLTICKDALIFF
jgi:hypothetical protein